MGLNTQKQHPGLEFTGLGFTAWEYQPHRKGSTHEIQRWLLADADPQDASLRCAGAGPENQIR